MEQGREEIAIAVENVCKVYKLYDKPMDRLVEALGFTKEKKYREHFALSNVNFHVKKGECIGIIGTNGSGKSTILKIITGVLNPSSGNVTVNGRISALLELGAGFNMEYTGMENIYLNGTMNGFSNEEIEKRIPDILEFADIGDYVNQPVKTYSSGMFVRLAFSVAINIEPEILIVDEALSVGDVFFQAKCYHKFEEFKEQGKTIIFVSHDLSSISKYCDRVILLNQGVKLGEGSAKEMIDDYKRVLVGQYELPESKSESSLLNDEEVQAAVRNKENNTDKDKPKLLEYGTSVTRELILVKIRATDVQRQPIMNVTEIYHGKIVDVTADSMVIELTGHQGKLDAFLGLLDGYEILELARTGVTGLARGSSDVTFLD